jgi:hypothetical protein
MVIKYGIVYALAASGFAALIVLRTWALFLLSPLLTFLYSHNLPRPVELYMQLLHATLRTFFSSHRHDRLDY